MKTLIVIDMQNDFVGGTLGTAEAKVIVPKIKKKIEQYISLGYEVIFTRDTHSENYLDTSEGKKLPVPHCIKGSKGWQIVDELSCPECEHIDKPSFGWNNWEFKGEEKRSFESIEIVGVCTDICVVSNALILKAKFPEIDITVDASLCAGVTPELHNAALITMKSCQINVINE